MAKKIRMPTDAEDREITRAALADPDAAPMSDVEWDAMPRVRGTQKMPTKTSLSIRLDADLVKTLKADGRGWQSRANALLRKAVGI